MLTGKDIFSNLQWKSYPIKLDWPKMGKINIFS